MSSPDPIQIDPIQTPPNDSDPVEESSTDFSVDDFLAKVEDSDRPVVEKYFQDWGGEVTQRFQKINDEYAPYKELGADVDQIGNALQIMQFADQDPVGFFNYIKETLIEMGHELDGGDTSPNDPTGGGLPEFEGVPEQFVQKFTAMEETLSGVNDFIKEQKSSQQAASNKQQLDDLLKTLHTEHGDFDEDAILGRMARGMDPKDAIKDYKEYLGKLNNPRPTPPPTLRTGGTPVDQVDAEKMRDKNFRKNYVAERLAAAAKE